MAILKKKSNSSLLDEAYTSVIGNMNPMIVDVINEEDEEEEATEDTVEDSGESDSGEESSDDNGGADEEDSSEDGGDEESDTEENGEEDESSDENEENGEEGDKKDKEEEGDEEDKPEYDFDSGRIFGFTSPLNKSWGSILMKYNEIPQDEDVLIDFGSSLRADLAFMASNKMLFKIHMVDKNNKEANEKIQITFSTISNKYDICTIDAKTGKKKAKKLDKETKTEILDSEVFKEEILPAVITKLTFIKDNFAMIDDVVINGDIQVNEMNYETVKDYIETRPFLQLIAKKKTK